MLTLQICYLLHKHIRRGETLVFLPEIYYNPTQYIYMYVKLNQKENLSPTMPEKFIAAIRFCVYKRKMAFEIEILTIKLLNVWQITLRQ